MSLSDLGWTGFFCGEGKVYGIRIIGIMGVIGIIWCIGKIL